MVNPLKDTSPSGSPDTFPRQELSKETILDFEKRNTRVLVVDDDDAIRTLMGNILQAENIPTAFPQHLLDLFRHGARFRLPRPTLQADIVDLMLRLR